MFPAKSAETLKKKKHFEQKVVEVSNKEVARFFNILERLIKSCYNSVTTHLTSPMKNKPEKVFSEPKRVRYMILS